MSEIGSLERAFLDAARRAIGKRIHALHAIVADGSDMIDDNKGGRCMKRTPEAAGAESRLRTLRAVDVDLANPTWLNPMA